MDPPFETFLPVSCDGLEQLHAGYADLAGNVDLPFALSLKLDLLRLQAALVSDDPRAPPPSVPQQHNIRRPPPPELARRVDAALTHQDMLVAAVYDDGGGARRDEDGADDELIRYRELQCNNVHNCRPAQQCTSLFASC